MRRITLLFFGLIVGTIVAGGIVANGSALSVGNRNSSVMYAIPPASSDGGAEWG